ncbi:MAG: ROK family protein [Pseudomonadota bacterium]
MISKEDHAPPTKQQIFELVRALGTVSRVEIARALEISPGSVTTLTSELIQAGFLREVAGPPRDTGRGRPPVALAVQPDAGYVIGAKLSDHKHTALLMDFSGQTLHHVSTPSGGRGSDIDRLVGATKGLIAQLLDDSGLSSDQISGLGLGLPGLVDFQSGSVKWSPLLSSRDVPLADIISEATSIDTLLDNDANLLTLAELWFGKGRDMSSFVMVTIENGIGMGCVLDNRLFRGVRGMGMELGHTKVQLDGALCRCGKRGCLEAYLSDYAMAREATLALGADSLGSEDPNATMQRLYHEAKAGNQAARSIFLRAARYLAVGLSNVMQIFDPERIILSGERLTFDYFYSEGVLDDMLSMTLDATRYADCVEVHAWGDTIWAKGACALALIQATNKAMSA